MENEKKIVEIEVRATASENFKEIKPANEVIEDEENFIENNLVAKVQNNDRNSGSD